MIEQLSENAKIWLEEAVKQQYFIDLLLKIETAYAQKPKDIFPEKDRVFHAFDFFKPSDTKVVIIGQDPYPTRGFANGLAFSVHPDIYPLPKSLKNIFKELQANDPQFEFQNGDLSPWAKQGVLLLNRVLTVEKGNPGSHFGIGWETFTAEIIKNLNQSAPLVYVLWGAKAWEIEKWLDTSKNHVLKTPHPSPLSAYRGFFGSQIFNQINQALIQQGKSPIIW